jgi:copper chaperone CopZ
MRYIKFLFVLVFPLFSIAQIKTVQLQAAGLTCSMCSNAINKSLRSLPNVNDVQTDLEKSTFIIRFKNADAANFDELKAKVEGAGFSVSKMQVQMEVNNLQVAPDAHTQIGGKQFHFVKVKQQQLNGNQLFTLVDKGFLPAKQFKTFEAATQMECIKTGKMAACCKGGSAGRIYHLTL